MEKDTILSRRTILAGLGLAAGGVAGVAMAQPPGAIRHERLRTAVQEMREARRYLAQSGHDFGGHKTRALEALDVAIREVEAALGA